MSHEELEALFDDAAKGPAYHEDEALDVHEAAQLLGIPERHLGFAL